MILADLALVSIKDCCKLLFSLRIARFFLSHLAFCCDENEVKMIENIPLFVLV